MFVTNKVDTVINVTRTVQLSSSMVKGFLTRVADPLWKPLKTSGLAVLVAMVKSQGRTGNLVLDFDKKFLIFNYL